MLYSFILCLQQSPVKLFIHLGYTPFLPTHKLCCPNQNHMLYSFILSLQQSPVRSCLFIWDTHPLSCSSFVLPNRMKNCWHLLMFSWTRSVIRSSKVACPTMTVLWCWSCIRSVKTTCTVVGVQMLLYYLSLNGIFTSIWQITCQKLITKSGATLWISINNQGNKEAIHQSQSCYFLI